MLDFAQIFDGTPPNTGVAVTATRVSTNVIDWLTGRDMGAANPLAIHVLVTETFATATSLQVSYEVCDTVGGTYLPLALSPVMLLANLVAGHEIFRVALPVNQPNNAVAGVLKTPGQYARLRYTVGGSDATAGKVFAWVSPLLDRDQYTTYPGNYTVAIAAGEI